MTDLFDTHAHFPNDPSATDQLLQEAAKANVTRLVAVGGSDELNSAARLAAALKPDQALLALGFDREQPLQTNFSLERVSDELKSTPIAAVGEIGLDYHYHHESSRQRAQRALMEHQLTIAADLGTPVIIHTRDADSDTLALLSNAQGHPWFRGERPGVIHCYTGGTKFAERLLELGYYISFSGIVTFANAKALRKVAAMIPDERLLIETDSPYLAPVPLRGRPNQPAYVIHVAECLARERGTGLDTIATLTTTNANKLFQS